MTRRFGEAVRTDRRYTRRPGVYAILPRQGQLLLTFQAAPRPEVQLPGGGIDPGESPLQALHREVFEETGWRIGQARRLGAYRRYTFMPEYDLWAEKICHIYVARPVRSLGAPAEPAHVALWMPAALALEELANSGEVAFLGDWLTRGGAYG